MHKYETIVMSTNVHLPFNRFVSEKKYEKIHMNYQNREEMS